MSIHSGFWAGFLPRTALLLGVGLVSVASTPELGPSAAMDPTLAAGSLCGQKRAGMNPARARLAAAAVAAPASSALEMPL